MRGLPGLVLAVLVVLAGCNAAVPTANESAEPTASDAPGAGEPAVSPPDPATDRLGWERGVWANETLAVDNGDGLNETELDAVISRAMARVETIRGQEFNRSVPVEIVSRAEFTQEKPIDVSDAYRTFDNAKFEAMFFVGEDADSLAVQRRNSGSNVLGFYDPANDTIKIVAGDGEPTLSGEGTLAHELVHALQDERGDLDSLRASTRDESNAHNGLVEGEAKVVERRYLAACGTEWQCLGSGGPPVATAIEDLHYGIYYLKYFPYADGFDFATHLRATGGWDAVTAAFEDPPASAEQVIYPDKYTGPRDDPVSVSLSDRQTGEWNRIRPDAPRPDASRADYATLGQSALSSMYGYTARVAMTDPTKQPVVPAAAFFNYEGRQVNLTDPFEYGLSDTEGWEGDRLHVYDRPGADNETAYVWRLAWESRTDAVAFANSYEALLRFWGAEPVPYRPDTYRIAEDENGFADAFDVRTNGTNVTIVNAPSVPDLAAVRPPADG